MKKSFKKVVSMLLAVIMVLGLVACGTDNKETTKAPATDAPEKTTEAQGKTDGETSGAEQTTEAPEVGITYPYDTDDKLTYWAGNQMTVAKCYTSWKESPFHTGISKMTGIDIEWQYPVSGADTKQAYNLLWVEDVFPDLVHFSVNPIDGKDMLDEGLIWDLTDYLPQYAPDYWAYINAPEQAKELNAILTEDGRHYYIPSVSGSVENLTYIGPIIRQDWLDECGLKQPVTIDEWEKVLVTLNEKYGAKMGFTRNYFNNTKGVASGFGAMSALTARYYVDKNGKIQYAQMQPEWKEMMETLAKWWEMGLIDVDSLTMDDKALQAKILDNKISITFVPMSRLNSYRNAVAKENGTANWVGMEYARTAPGEPTCAVTGTATRCSGQGTMITKSCSEEKLITALAFLNYAFTEEGYNYWNFGEEGVTYNWVDGKPVWTDLMTKDELGLATAMQKYTGNSGSSPAIQSEWIPRLRNGEVVAAAATLWGTNTNYTDYMVPSIVRNSEEQAVIDQYNAPLSTYVSEEALKFLNGTRPISEFDAFVAKLKEMGIEKCIEAQQAAYDRYVDRVKK